tara:strand:+ start:455 stop:874 length:420 start_codon:yes stop_codon:yes gene_type:complete
MNLLLIILISLIGLALIKFLVSFIKNKLWLIVILLLIGLGIYLFPLVSGISEIERIENNALIKNIIENGIDLPDKIIQTNSIQNNSTPNNITQEIYNKTSEGFLIYEGVDLIPYLAFGFIIFLILGLIIYFMFRGNNDF